MPDGHSIDTCPRCEDSLVPGKLYCPNCGLALVSLPERVAINAFVKARVQQAMSARLSDQNSLVREIGDKAEDVVWTRLKRYTWALAIAGFLLSVYGITSIHQAKTAIVDNARSRLEPVIADTEKRAKAAQKDVGDTELQIGVVKKQLDGTARLADEQSTRITDQGGQIKQKLDDVQKAVDRAN